MPPPGCTQSHPPGQTPDLGNCFQSWLFSLPPAAAALLFSTSCIPTLWVLWASSFPSYAPQFLGKSVDLSHLEISVRSSPQNRVVWEPAGACRLSAGTGRQNPCPAPHSYPGANPAGPLSSGLFSEMLWSLATSSSLSQELEME